MIRAMGFAPYGEYWRDLRRISATHLFSPKRIAGFEGFRRDVGVKMIEEIKGRDKGFNGSRGCGFDKKGSSFWFVEQ